MEQLLHYVWKHKLFPLGDLRTTDGQPVEVLNPGLQNGHAGPDFSNAHVVINGVEWAGNVELHVKASDWYLHHHDNDERYDNVILHVVNESDALITRRSGSVIPQLVLPIPPYVRDNYTSLLNADRYPPCYRVVGSLPVFFVHNCLSALLFERLDMRAQQIQERWQQHDMNWNDAFFATLARNFGFGVNGDAFDAWARSIPFRAVDHHRDDLMQVEAFFFGQAGLLEASALPASCRDEAATDTYFCALRKEYTFLAHKFSLTPIPASMWKFARMRPDNSPFIRMAQLAMLYHRGEATMSSVLEANGHDALARLLCVGTSDYWNTHFCFGSATSAARPKIVGESALSLLIINTVAPVLYAYGRRRNDDACVSRAIALLEQMAPEDNNIIRAWKECGLTAAHAADSQALIHLKRLYCDRHDCLRCRIGYEYLRRPLP